MRIRLTRGARIMIAGAAFLSLIPSGKAYFESAPKIPGKEPEMNGIRMSQYSDFVKKWHLVTVRFRKDSNEMRFVYANDQAWNSLQTFSGAYPDGAVFAKVGMIAETDPAFTSSVVPARNRRFQFMVRDAKKYSGSDGWGYALFDDQGRLFKDDPRATTQGCVACHRIVPERGYVFSRVAWLDPGNALAPYFGAHAAGGTHDHRAAVKFALAGKSKLPAALVRRVGSDHVGENWDYVEGDLRSHAFSGTLDEVVPLLVENSGKSHVGSILLVNDRNWSAAMPLPARQDCMNGQSYRIIVYFNDKPVRDAEICQ